MTKSEAQEVEIDLNGIVTEVLSLTHSGLLRYQVSVHTALAPTLPPVFGDRVQLQQVFLNLIMNGIEAMASVAGRPKELTIETRTEGADHVLVLVHDSGVGLSPEQANQIFDAFFTTKPEGTGMGLAICRSSSKRTTGASGHRQVARTGLCSGSRCQRTMSHDGTHEG
jgi:signal transduction histidine kinase